MKVDRFFSEETAKIALNSGEIACAGISPTWLNATNVRKTDFEPIMAKKNRHLISAHGDILKDKAYERI